MKVLTFSKLTVAGLLIASVASADFTMPDQAALNTLISNPARIEQMIGQASEEQCAMLIIQVISLMQANDIESATIQKTVAVMFQKTAEVHGAEYGSAVVSLVRKRVNPRLLPIIRTGNAAPPPSSPGYTRQR